MDGIGSKRSMEENVAQKMTSPVGALWVHLILGLGIAVGFSLAHYVYSIDLVSDPAHTLLILWVVECPISILLYSFLRHDPSKCSYLRGVGRGIVGLPSGALVIALCAIALGAPVGTKFFFRTVSWSLFLSLFTFAPTAAVFGSSFPDWQRLFANTRPTGSIDYMLCLPAHGAVLGSWFGAWPMPLDWERPWQEWPICVTYGGVAGYVIGLIASFGSVLICSRRLHAKAE